MWRRRRQHWLFLGGGGGGVIMASIFCRTLFWTTTTTTTTKTLIWPNKDNVAVAADTAAIVATTTTTTTSRSSWTIPPRPVLGLHDKLANSLWGHDNNVPKQATATSYLAKLEKNDCRPTSQIRITSTTRPSGLSNPSQQQSYNQPQPQRPSSGWILQAMDDKGVDKRLGGDEFYIAYFDNYDNNGAAMTEPTAVALVQDRHDGTYELDFVTTPLRRNQSLDDEQRRGSKGTLHVFFQYTCGMGQLSPPTKASWQSAGLVNLHFQQENVPRPPIRPFQPPTQYNLSTYAAVFFVGDSTFRQLTRRTTTTTTTTTSTPAGGRRQHAAFRPNTYMADVIQADLNTATVLPNFVQHVVTRHDKDLKGLVPGGGTAPNKGEQNNIALVIGSAVWDILASSSSSSSATHNNATIASWEDHLTACRIYVQEIRKLYPHVDLFWKSANALHVHRLPADCTARNSCNQRTRYMSSWRAESLYRKQKDLMERLHVPFLDLYEASYLSAYQSRPDDGRHYEDEWNDQMSKFLFGLDG